MEMPVKRKLYSDMLRIRLVEERIADLYPEQEMRCPVHLSIGQEAVAAGICAALNPDDLAFSGHRNHAHYIAKGGDLRRMFAEVYGKATGCCKGKGGSMHLTDQDVGFVGSAPIVGSTIPIAVGAALAAEVRSEKQVTVIFFGDGAADTDVFHESLGFAALKGLPVLFVCENNLYSVYSPMEVRQSPRRTITQLAAGHGVAARSLDGNDVEVVWDAGRDAVTLCRDGKGPVLLEFSTYRWREHCGPNYDDDLGYRTPEEAEEWCRRDPVAVSRRRLEEQGEFTGPDADAIASAITAEIDAAVAFAKASPFPDSSEYCTEVYA